MCEPYHIAPFGRAEVMHTLHAVLGPSLASSHAHLLGPRDGVVDRIVDSAQGMPFLVQTLALNLRHSLGTGTYKGLEELSVGSHAIVVTAMDRLSHVTQVGRHALHVQHHSRTVVRI
jgi:hypothetical protein